MSTGFGPNPNPAAYKQFTAGAAIDIDYPRYGKSSGTEGEIVLCSVAGEQADVIIVPGDYDSGDPVDCYVLGMGGSHEVECGGSADQFDNVATDADGKAVEATAGDQILGQFAADAADGEVQPVTCNALGEYAASDGQLATDLASTANGDGASMVGVEDADGLLTADDVEAALAELKAPGSVTKADTATLTLAECCAGLILVTKDRSSAGATITLPSAAALIDGLELTIKATGAGSNAVTIDTEGDETIDGSADNEDIDAQYDCLRLRADGGDWHIVGGVIAA